MLPYIKNLTSIIPQKDYSSLYGERSFYVYSRDISQDSQEHTTKDLLKFNQTVEQVFVFTAREFLRRGEQRFMELFCNNGDVEESERSSMEELFEHYHKEFL